MSWLIVGASSGLGRALAERFAADGRSLFLIARDERDLTALATDLQLRFDVTVRFRALDARDVTSIELALSEASNGENFEGALFPIGVIAEDDRADAITLRAEELLSANFLSVVVSARLLLPEMLRRQRGAIVGFGSVAAVRGRTNNAVYAASKAALERFFESLRHACEPAGIHVQFYTLGYLDTNLAFGRKLLFPKADPSHVARRVAENLNRGGGKWHLPSFWKPIVMILRILPWSIFQRLRF